MRGQRGLVIGLGVAVLLTAVCAAATSASDDAVIERFWGRDISVRELLLAITPELLGEFPQAALNTTVQWGAATTRAEWVGEPGAKSNDANDEGTRDISDIVVSHDNIFDVWGKTVDYGASSTVIWPPFTRMDMMSVFGFLLEDGDIIETTGETDYDVWSITTLDSCRVDGGAVYRNMSYHYVDYPTGYWPPTAFVVLYSWEAWIDE